MGKNEYYTIEEAASYLDKPVRWVRGKIWGGEVSARTEGAGWLILRREIHSLHARHPQAFQETSQTKVVVHNFLHDRTKPLSSKKIEPSTKFSSSSSLRRTAVDMKELEKEVKELASRIEVELISLLGGKAIWGRIKQDRFKPNKKQMSQLPDKLQALLRKLRRIKQEFILRKQTEFYRQILLSMPEWNSKSVDKFSKTQSELSNRKKVKLAKGIEGYYGGEGAAQKRYWWNEE